MITASLIFTTAQTQNGFYNSTIREWTALCRGSQIIHYNYHFGTITFILASFTDVLFSLGITSNKTEAVPVGKVQNKEVTVTIL